MDGNGNGNGHDGKAETTFLAAIVVISVSGIAAAAVSGAAGPLVIGFCGVLCAQIFSANTVRRAAAEIVAADKRRAAEQRQALADKRQAAEDLRVAALDTKEQARIAAAKVVELAANAEAVRLAAEEVKATLKAVNDAEELRRKSSPPPTILA